MRKFIVVLLIPVIYLTVAVLTLSDYSFNTDEPFHFYRGQAYFHYFLTGKKDYKDLPVYPKLNEKRCQQKPAPDDCFISPSSPGDTTEFLGTNYTHERAVSEKYKKGEKRRSFFQHDQFTFEEAIKMENGHPPLGGILAASTNYLFFQRLHILDDIESHHLAEVLLSFTVLLATSVFTYKLFGTTASLVASSSIATYPLFFSESHFNIKDPVETAFFGLTIIFFYFGMINKNWKLLIASAVFTGMALGTKLNIVFVPLIIVPWLSFYLYLELIGKKQKDFFKVLPKKSIAALFAFPVIALGTFYIPWPYLWPDPISNIQVILKYYKEIGTGSPSELEEYIIKGFNSFPIIWILITTPIAILALSFIGFITAIYKLIKSRKHEPLLILLWLLVPIGRVSLPNTAIYGGVRHIMEFILPLGILCGLGATTLINRTRHKPLGIALIVVLLSFTIWENVRIHPNQNVYFNQFVGGLSGAAKRNIPYWGNSYGNAYLQGINWLNENAEPNARLGLPVSTMANIPRQKLRSDIDFNNGYWSGPNRLGEYEIEMTHNHPQKRWYSFSYYDTYLNPVYEARVNGVSILKVWKNDLEHTKPDFKEEVSYEFITKEFNGEEIVLDLQKKISLTRITIEHGLDNCEKVKGGYIATSLDGINWDKEPEAINYPQVPPKAVGWDDDTFVFLFPAKPARYVSINTMEGNTCILKNHILSVQGIKQLPAD